MFIIKLINFILSYFEDGLIIKNRRLIILKYMKKYFLKDFLSITPFYFRTFFTDTSTLQKYHDLAKYSQLLFYFRYS